MKPFFHNFVCLSRKQTPTLKIDKVRTTMSFLKAFENKIALLYLPDFQNQIHKHCWNFQVNIINRSLPHSHCLLCTKQLLHTDRQTYTETDRLTGRQIMIKYLKGFWKNQISDMQAMKISGGGIVHLKTCAHELFKKRLYLRNTCHWKKF